MADLPDTPTLQGGDNGNGDYDKASNKRQRPVDDDDDDDGEGKGRERRKIDIKFIQDKSRRHITFSKRKAGIMKKVCANFNYAFGLVDNPPCGIRPQNIERS